MQNKRSLSAAPGDPQRRFSSTQTFLGVLKVGGPGEMGRRPLFPAHLSPDPQQHLGLASKTDTPKQRENAYIWALEASGRS